MHTSQISERLSNIFVDIGINTIITHDMSFIDCDETDSFITFIPTKKVNETKYRGFDPWKSNRNKIRVGKFLNSILCVDDVIIENLTNQYKTYYKIEMGYIEEIFDIVDGKDIHFYFQRSNYVPGGGSLSGSCMTGADAIQLKLYIDNPKSIKLLVIKQGDKVSGRSLMWSTDKGVYIDRPYCRFDKDHHLYTKYAEKMGFRHYYKDRMAHLTVNKLKIPRGTKPYLDTFKIINSKTVKNF